ncbi:MAG: hypothetical protein FJ387_26650 [Verrucomicrobia bacterium]|nr:hypothetical protein [Verrucomicrobiota bacterium]
MPRQELTRGSMLPSLKLRMRIADEAGVGNHGQCDRRPRPWASALRRTGILNSQRVLAQGLILWCEGGQRTPPADGQSLLRVSPTTPYRKRLALKLAETLQAPLPTATPRRVHGVVSVPNKATAVIGMRRSGKTTFLHQLRQERLDKGVARERLVYVNFEDEQLAGLQAAQLNSLLEDYYRRLPRSAKLGHRHAPRLAARLPGRGAAARRDGAAAHGESAQGLPGGPRTDPGV